jgi:predicted ferric reductase
MTAVSHRPATDTTRRGPSRSLHPFFLIAVYIGLALATLVIAYAQGFPPRDWRDEFSSALALTGFAGLLIEFLLSGRFRFVSTHLGIDTTMRFHQLMARSLTVFILVHPFLYVTPILNDPFPWDTTGVHTLGLTGVSLITGLIA